VIQQKVLKSIPKLNLKTIGKTQSKTHKNLKFKLNPKFKTKIFITKTKIPKIV